MKLPRKTFEFVDSSLITSSPTKLRIEWYLSFTTICILLASFVFWNSPSWLYYADIAYLQLVLSIFLAGVVLSFSWIIFAMDRFFIRKLRVKKYNIEFAVSFVPLPFEFFVVSVLIDYITNFRPITFDLHGITAGFIIVSLLILSLWCAFSLERWHSIKRKLSGEEDEDRIWVEDWVDEYEKTEDRAEEDKYVEDEDYEEIDYST
ncbi:MAG: hypothetical protein ACW963_01970 [Candidatus Sifarchaeia archaeon]